MSSDDREGRFSKLRAGLLADALDRPQKLGILKMLVDLKAEGHSVAILTEAAKAPVNDAILTYVVRAFGYMGGLEVLPVLAEYIHHPRRSVVANALKAAAAIDPSRAVEMALPAIRQAPLETVAVICGVLAERCPDVAAPAVARLATSTVARERLAALLYFKQLPPADGVSPVVEMLGAERDPELLGEQAQLLAARLTRSGAGPIEQLRQELARKLDVVDGLLARLPEQLPEQAPGSQRPGGARPEAPEQAAVASKGHQESLEIFGPEVELALGGYEHSRPAARPRGETAEVPAAAGSTQPVSPARPSAMARPLHEQLLPWQEKERRKKRRLSLSESSRIIHEELLRTSRSRLLLVGALVVLGVYVTHHLGRPRPAQGEASWRRPVDVLDGPIGHVGERVKLGGRLLEVSRNHTMLILKTDRGVLVSASFADEVAGLEVGKQVLVEGVLREIRSPTACVVQGSRVREL